MLAAVQLMAGGAVRQAERAVMTPSHFKSSRQDMVRQAYREVCPCQQWSDLATNVCGHRPRAQLAHNAQLCCV